MASDFDTAQAELAELREAYVACGEREHSLRERLAGQHQVDLSIDERALFDAHYPTPSNIWWNGSAYISGGQEFTIHQACWETWQARAKLDGAKPEDSRASE